MIVRTCTICERSPHALRDPFPLANGAHSPPFPNSPRYVVRPSNLPEIPVPEHINPSRAIDATDCFGGRTIPQPVLVLSPVSIEVAHPIPSTADDINSTSSNTALPTALVDGTPFPHYLDRCTAFVNEYSIDDSGGLSRQSLDPSSVLAPSLLAQILPNVYEAEVKQILKNRGFKATVFKIDLTSAHIQRLKVNGWLNDDVIDAYCALIGARASPGIFVLPSTLYHKLLDARERNVAFSDDHRVHGQTKKSFPDLLNGSLILLPINIPNLHWVAAAVDIKQGLVKIYDSLQKSYGSLHGVIFRNLCDWIQEESCQRMQSVPILKLVPPGAKIPQQTNSADCGIFTLQFIEALSRGESSFRFNADHTTFLRRKMIWELANAKLLTEEIKNSPLLHGEIDRLGDYGQYGTRLLPEELAEIQDDPEADSNAVFFQNSDIVNKLPEPVYNSVATLLSPKNHRASPKEGDDQSSDSEPSKPFNVLAWKSPRKNRWKSPRRNRSTKRQRQNMPTFSPPPQSSTSAGSSPSRRLRLKKQSSLAPKSPDIISWSEQDIIASLQWCIGGDLSWIHEAAKVVLVWDECEHDSIFLAASQILLERVSNWDPPVVSSTNMALAWQWLRGNNHILFGGICTIIKIVSALEEASRLPSMDTEKWDKIRDWIHAACLPWMSQ
ncbi:hypothetical protein D9757_013403 [Collybiopsis confluens]|uniref:Ubiquitin-like protease family profile domain-containing protein n=1 Tax=Collybiopsis confluens TaxID=2823264 RepID=A0A8H5D6K4_9AGAR|nr:hypothetical protein D9757_013403 [Collybiopsis confluens]